MPSHEELAGRPGPKGSKPVNKMTGNSTPASADTRFTAPQSAAIMRAKASRRDCISATLRELGNIEDHRFNGRVVVGEERRGGNIRHVADEILDQLRHPRIVDVGLRFVLGGSRHPFGSGQLLRLRGGDKEDVGRLLRAKLLVLLGKYIDLGEYLAQRAL